MFRIDQLIYLFVLCIAFYIIIKHFFSSDHEHSKDEIDRLIEEKKRSLGGSYSKVRDKSQIVKIKEKISDPFLLDIQKNLEWAGVVELDQEISEEISKLLDEKCVLKDCSSLASELLTKFKSKNDFLEFIGKSKLRSSLNGEDSFRINGLKKNLMPCSFLICMGKIDEVFDIFNGEKESMKNIKVLKDDLDKIADLKLRSLIEKMKSVSLSLEKLILLNDAQINSLVGLAKNNKIEYKKFLKTYHPDTMDLHIIPKTYKEKFMKIYSHQFSRIKDLISSHS